jgi:cell division protein FtsI (penicillin-binding protein 3)
MNMKSDRVLIRRLYVLITILSLWGAAIGFRLYFLHVVRSADYRQRAERQQQRTLEISPRRGVIYDRNGNELAVSIKVDSLFAVPDEVEDPEKTAKALSPLIGVPKKDLIEKLRSTRSFVWIKRKLNAEQAAKVQDAKVPGMYFQKEDMRYYPKRDMAAHVLGYVDVDEKGLGGLEYRYNGSIRGESGRVLVMTDARGRRFNSVEQPVEPGADLVTTIDENIQYIAEKELKAAVTHMRPKGATAIVMDPQSGQILAMANYPTFNPNEYGKFGAVDWINRAVSHTYEPGSTFKIVTTASALEEGLTHPDEVIDCQMGSINVFGRTVRDHKPFGLLTVTQILGKSSDVGAIKLAMRVGDDRFADYISRMGFGKMTDVDLPGEERGLFKPASRWTKSSVGSIAMGQEIGATPLQIVRMVSAVANGGILYRPYVVKRVQHPQNGLLSETEPQGERVLSSETAARLRAMLETVVTEGTAISGKLEGYTAAGKTGTAQKIDETRRYSPTAHVASFAGFAPASNPAVSIIVVVDEPAYGLHHGSQVAPVFKRIAEQVLRYLAIPPDVPSYAPQYALKTPEKPNPRPAPVEDRRPAYIPVSTAGLQTAGYDAGALGEIIVPDFYGKSLRQVTEDSLKAGFRLQSIGSGAAIDQTPPAGTIIRPGASVQVRFSSRLGGE